MCIPKLFNLTCKRYEKLTLNSLPWQTILTHWMSKIRELQLQPWVCSSVWEIIGSWWFSLHWVSLLSFWWAPLRRNTPLPTWFLWVQLDQVNSKWHRLVYSNIWKHFLFKARVPWPMPCLAVTPGVTMTACSVSAEVWTPAQRTQPSAQDSGLVWLIVLLWVKINICKTQIIKVNILDCWHSGLRWLGRFW